MTAEKNSGNSALVSGIVLRKGFSGGLAHAIQPARLSEYLHQSWSHRLVAATSFCTTDWHSAKNWFIRLIPPRPTFDKDESPAEQALMEEHFTYWKALYDKGVCVFGGPVLDPRGVYGVLALDAANEDAARALGEGDPSVKAGVNRIEVAEMRAVFLHRAG